MSNSKHRSKLGGMSVGGFGFSCTLQSVTCFDVVAAYDILLRTSLLKKEGGGAGVGGGGGDGGGGCGTPGGGGGGESMANAAE